MHCLSSSGRRDPRELTISQCEHVIDELQRMQVFYVNIGGGEPTIRPDFWHLLDYPSTTECVQGFGEAALAGERIVPAPSQDHSRRAPTRNEPVLQLSRRTELSLSPAAPPVSACAEHPLAGFTPAV